MACCLRVRLVASWAGCFRRLAGGRGFGRISRGGLDLVASPVVAVLPGGSGVAAFGGASCAPLRTASPVSAWGS